MEVNKIVNGVLTLKKLNEQDFSLATTLKIVRNSEEFDRVLQAFNSKRQTLYDEFMAEDTTEERKTELDKEMSILLSEEIEVTFKSLKIEEIEDMKLSATELTSILWLIEGEDA